MTKLAIKNIVNSEIAVSTEKGEMVFEAINSHLQKKEKVIVDFKGIDLMIAAFLTAAIGNLYNQENYSDEFLKEYVKIENASTEDVSLINDVIESAKEYREDAEGFNRILDELIYDGSYI